MVPQASAVVLYEGTHAQRRALTLNDMTLCYQTQLARAAMLGATDEVESVSDYHPAYWEDATVEPRAITAMARLKGYLARPNNHDAQLERCVARV